MIYITGDLHADWRDLQFRLPSAEYMSYKDVVILLGDVGANYYRDIRDEAVKFNLSSYPCTFCASMEITKIDQKILIHIRLKTGMAVLCTMSRSILIFCLQKTVRLMKLTAKAF